MSIRSKDTRRNQRKAHIRKTVVGTAERPRLSIYKSLKHMHAQLIDDVQGVTIVATSTTQKEVSAALSSVKGKTEQSKALGKILAEKALQANIATVVFDRNGFIYHGRVKALADGAREGGLNF